MFKLIQKLPNIDEVKSKYPANLKLKQKRDKEIADILTNKDNRILLIVGPCSLDSEYGIYTYLDKLSKLNQQVGKLFYIVPRLYTSKPRSLNGFKGLIHWPNYASHIQMQTEIDCGGQSISEGIWFCRKILTRVLNDYNLTGADELLYPDLHFYFDDLISYAAIGTRSSENQQHRMFASGLCIAAGFKNPLNGSINSLINSVYAARLSHNFAVCNNEYNTSGNPLAHAVFRGYVDKDAKSHANTGLEYYLKFLSMQAEYNPAIATISNKSQQPIPFLVDASHDNSSKNYLKQNDVVKTVVKNLLTADYKRDFKGLMLESYLVQGKNLAQNQTPILGCSMTDECLSFEQTKDIILYFLDNY